MAFVQNKFWVEKGSSFTCKGSKKSGQTVFPEEKNSRYLEIFYTTIIIK